MLIEELSAINRKALESIAKSRADNTPLPEPLPPYYGYFEVDIFECPPFVMFTNDDSPGATNILYRRRFEPQSMKLWCRLCHTATGILDIGANVGIYSLCASLLRPDLEIHAFEPNPYAYARLRMHKTINGLTNLIEHSVLVGHQNGLTNFGWTIKPGGHISSGGHIMNTGSKDSRSESMIAHMITLDEMGLAQTLGRHPLVKIDVEGSEVYVIQGMKDVVTLKPDILIESFSPEACDALNAIFLPLGYRAYLVEETAGRLIAQDRLHPCKKDPPYDFNQFLTARPADEIAALNG